MKYIPIQKFICLVLILSFLASGPQAFSAWADPAQDLRASLQAILYKNIAKSKITPGASLCVIFPGQSPVAVAAGKNAIGDQGRSLGATDNFRLASITKTYIATLTLLLSEQGLLEVDAMARNYFPVGLKAGRIPNGTLVTLRHLLAMRSGIPDYLDQERFDFVFSKHPRHRWTARETIELVYGKRPLFRPGLKYYYSNTNYTLLGLVLSTAASQRLADLLRNALLDPLSLGETFLEFGSARRKLSTHGYELGDNDQLLDVTKSNDGLGLGDGGLISTSCDVARFIEALFLERTVLSEAKLQEMVDFDSRSSYGLGVERVMTKWGEAWTHNGSSSGFQGEYYYFPASGIVWVLLTNSFETDIIEPALRQSMPVILEKAKGL